MPEKPSLFFILNLLRPDGISSAIWTARIFFSLLFRIQILKQSVFTENGSLRAAVL